ncbi:serine protease [Vibrio sp. HA2012]|uniref:S1 family peptidase n=1 Tax=Vibrio sp. HA2012 TaxID=1971595 RepID=UPI000C2B7E76|nr:serine protease [Vibrio sp. HA2012]PJC87252.1 serine protease [Vibrio sp. HA2012]
MKLVLSCCLSFPFLITSFQAFSTDVSTYIVNGEVTTTTEFDTFVSLYYNDGTSSGIYCGGTIIDDTHVLTAAHCVRAGYMDYTSIVQVDDESSSTLSNAEKYTVASYYYRGDYVNSDSQLWPNDIAIIELVSGINTSASTSPVATQTDYQSSSEIFTAVGHGNTSTGVDDEETLLKTNLIYVSTSDCQTALGSAITSNHLCFDGEQDGTTYKDATCQGDSGGPVYWNDNGDYKQVGIVSFGPSTCGLASSDVVTVTTEISDYTDWIEGVINNSPSSLDVVTYKCTISGSSVSCAQYSSSSSSSSSGGGGSIPLFSSLCLLIAALVRKHRH